MVVQDFDFFSSIIRNRSGINLEEDKTYLIESRLQMVVKKYSFKSIADVVAEIKNHQNENLIYDVIEALTTNETLFFRDLKIFDSIKNIIIPQFMSVNKNSVNVWSAACSTGQEPYSVAMCFADSGYFVSGNSLKILATDISKKVLAKSATGEYSQLEVQRGLPVTMLMKYFDNKDELWFVREEIKNKIEFKYFNLIENMNSIPNNQDIILCRNVLIYFTQDTKIKILTSLSSKLSDDGYLFIGASETILGAEYLFDKVDGMVSTYKKKK